MDNSIEIVRCWECKKSHGIVDQYGNVDYYCRKMNDYMTAADYCSRGEKKEELKK